MTTNTNKPTALTRRFVLSTPILAAPLFLGGCRNSDQVIQVTGQTMGTTYSVIATDKTGTTTQDHVRSAINEALQAVNAEMSNWDETSEISRFNAAATNDPVNVSAGLAQVVDAASQVKSASGGRFDLSVGPLVELWGFGTQTGLGSLPSEAKIADALDATGQVRLAGETAIAKSHAKSEIFVSALGKGHGADRVAHGLQKLGLENYFVEIGGDLVTAGRNPKGEPWQIGIETPVAHDRGIHEIVGVSGFAVATSGDYRNYFERDGVRYSHILDAKTGYPVSHKTASATVIAEDAMMADAWSTAMLILGRDRGMALAEEHSLAVSFIERGDGAGAEGFVTTASPRYDSLVTRRNT